MTTVCAIAARFSTDFAHVADKLSDLAKKLCFAVPSRGTKTTEIVQGYLLLSAWTISFLFSVPTMAENRSPPPSSDIPKLNLANLASH